MPTFNGTASEDTLTGTSADDIINGAGGNDRLVGLEGNDRLVGGTGTDVMRGGIGDDTYYVDNAGDLAVEFGSEGTDLVYSSVTYRLREHVENLTLTGTAVRGVGNSTTNRIVGNTGNNVLDGQGGADVMRGGLGNDIYYVDDGNDLAIESAGEGTDLVYSSATYRLREDVENLTLTGAAVRAIGNSGVNRIIGNASNNILDGQAGADVMRGGLGDDRYYVDNVGDRAIENAGEGTDTVYSSINFVLGADVENLNLLGADAQFGTGNALDNRLVGNAANNVLDGGAGADVMRGGLGNDSYIVDDAGDHVIENGGEGYDYVYSLVSFTLGSNLESLTLNGNAPINGTGNSLDNFLTGNESNNVLTAGDGNDSLSGQDGTDSLDGGAGDDSIDGGAYDDTLIGGDGNDVLWGGTGIDTLDGGAGNDTYYVDGMQDSAAPDVIFTDTVIEGAGGGSDTVWSMVDVYTLPENVEIGRIANDAAGGHRLYGNGASNTLTGSANDDFLYGQGGNDIIDGGLGEDRIYGGAGADNLTGGSWNDTFFYTAVSDSTPTDTDVIFDYRGTGIDDNHDLIDLSGIDANVNVDGDQAFTLVGAPTNAAGQLWISSEPGNQYTIYGDVNGDGEADFQLHLVMTNGGLLDIVY